MDAYTPLAQSTIDASQPGQPDPLALDHLLHSKSRILRTKLEVLASEIQARFALWDRNRERIHTGKGSVEALLDQSTHLARYHLQHQRDVTRLHESALRLESERRHEDIQCWRDVVQVMRDFLDAWETHEQARNRSIFLHHAGSRPEDSV